MKKQGHIPHNQEVNELIERVPKMIGMIKLADEDFRTAIINMFKDSKKTRNTNKD